MWIVAHCSGLETVFSTKVGVRAATVTKYRPWIWPTQQIMLSCRARLSYKLRWTTGAADKTKQDSEGWSWTSRLGYTAVYNCNELPFWLSNHKNPLLLMIWILELLLWSRNGFKTTYRNEDIQWWWQDQSSIHYKDHRQCGGSVL